MVSTQRCPAARTLDVIGERWTLLIVRELILGPKRYTDLLDALPGIGTNVLAGRLSDLRKAGVIAKRTLPPPTPVAVYELTKAGEALGPLMRELRRWGQEYAPAPEPDDAVRPGWVLQSAASRSQFRGTCELRVGREVFELTGGDSEVTVKSRPATNPDAVVTIAPDDLYRLAAGKARDRHGLTVTGDQTLAAELLTMLEGAVV